MSTEELPATSDPRTGGVAVLATLAACGVPICFTNPGTSEMHVVRALDVVRGVQPVLTLAETVATGAADGWARVTGAPASVLLHLGPGLANGIANLHNAKRARSPVVMLVGDHATDHRHRPSPLQSDIAALAAPVSAWVGDASSPARLGRDVAEAVAASRERRGVATLVLPADVTWTSPVAPAEPRAVLEPPVSDDAVDTVGALLADPEVAARTALLLDGTALHAPALADAERVAAATGARLFAPMGAGRVDRRPGASLQRLPYFPDTVVRALEPFEHLVLVGADAPLAWFAYPGDPRVLVPSTTRVSTLADPTEDAAGALAALAARFGAGHDREVPLVSRPERPSGRLDARTFAQAVAATLPEGAIVVDESATSGVGLWPSLAGVPHDLLALTGGAIGSGPPLATGAAFAAPGRRIVNVEGDGSFCYSLQSLWTQARHGLDVTTVVAANRAYAILSVELHRAGDAIGEQAPLLTRIDRPTIDFVQLAAGFGVAGERVEDAGALCAALERAAATPGPSLIEAVL